MLALSGIAPYPPFRFSTKRAMRSLWKKTLQIDAALCRRAPPRLTGGSAARVLESDPSNAPGRGVELGQRALRAHGLGDTSEVLRVINAGERAELVWACGWLVAAFEEAVLHASRGDKKKTRRILWAAATNNQDAVVTQALVVLADADTKKEGH